jgi:hypothetical protein
MGGQVRHSDVWALLDHCAPGWSKELKKHRVWIRWNGKTYIGMPKGPGRTLERDHDVAIQKVRQMVTHLDIDPACAHGAMPQLGPMKKTNEALSPTGTDNET